MADMHALAEDLDQFLAGLKAPQLTVKPAPVKLEAVATPDLDQLVRAAWDYTTSRLVEQDGATTIGEAFMVATAGLAKDAGVDQDAMSARALGFLTKILESAKAVA